MKKKIKIIVEIHSTKRDSYGNCYHMAKIINTANHEGFSTGTPSASNIEHILFDAFGDWRKAGIYKVEVCTESARLNSLPESSHCLNQCHYGRDWKKALNGIGFRGLKAL